MGGVAVTGATGFLGGAVCRRLLSEGAGVLALGRDAGKLGTLSALGAATLSHDLSEGPPPTAAREIDAVVHCAALSSAWGRRADFQAANVVGTRSALDWARQIGARRFVHISTPSLYFRFRDQPGVREDAALPRPVNAYAATKRAGEALVLGDTGLDVIVLRPRGIYGVGDTALLPRLLRAAQSGPLPLIRGGQAKTDLTHVEDVVDAILAALTAPMGLSDRVFNISGGEPLPIRSIAERAGARAGLPIRWRTVPAAAAFTAARLFEAGAAFHPRRPEPRVTAYGAGLFAFTQTLDISAAHRALGWRPRIGFDEGLALTFGQTP